MTSNASSYTGKESVLQYTCRASVEQGCVFRFAGGTDSLLDLACGRGGDIWKWTDARVRSLVADHNVCRGHKAPTLQVLPADQVHQGD